MKSSIDAMRQRVLSVWGAQRGRVTTAAVAIMATGAAQFLNAGQATAVGVPSAPAAPTVTAASLSAVVSWVAPSNNGSSITGYTVTSTDSTLSSRGGQTCTTTTAVTCTVTGLTAGDSYTMSVVATNSYGSSSASPSTAYTPTNIAYANTQQSMDSNSTSGTFGDKFSVIANDTIDGVVMDKAAGNTGTNSVALWSSTGTQLATASYTGGTGQGWQTVLFPTSVAVTAGSTYYVSFYSTTATRYYYGSFTSAGTVTTSNIVYPTTNSNYYSGGTNGFPSTGGGPGTYYIYPMARTDEVNQPTIPAVTTPTLSSGTSGLTVTWTAGTGGPIGSYKVTLNDVTKSTSTSYTGIASSATSYTVSSGLTGGDTFTAQIQALGSATTTYSPLSAASNTASWQTAPSTPAAPSATAAAASAAVTWTDPSNNGGAISGYTVTAGDSTIASRGGQTCTTTGAVTCTVTGLTAGDSYTFTVVATNTYGTSLASPASNSVTPYAVATYPQPGNYLDSSTSVDTNGTAFTLAKADSIEGVVFYKYAGTTGTIVLSLWNSAGTKVATTTVAASTAQGWETAKFASAYSASPGSYTVSAFLLAGSTRLAAGAFTSQSTVGNVTYPVGAGRYNASSSESWPTSSVNATYYVWPLVGSNDSIQPSLTPAPTSVAATLSGTAVTVTWAEQTLTAANGGAATDYKIVINDTTAGTSNSASPVDTGSTATSYTITSGLTATHVYTFQVIAIAGPTTAPVNISTASGVSSSLTYTIAPSAPAAPSATATAGGVTVTWTAPASNGGPITGYTATTTDTTTPGNGGQTCATTGSLSCTMTGLTVGDTYTVSVTATNTYGTSPVSPPSNTITPYTTPGVPTAVTATAGVHSAQVSFTAPANTGYTTITGYTVTATDVTSSARGGQVATAATSPVTVSSLTPGDSYTFTVYAANAAGNSAPSTATTSVKPTEMSYSNTDLSLDSSSIGGTFGAAFTVANSDSVEGAVLDKNTGLTGTITVDLWSSGGVKLDSTSATAAGSNAQGFTTIKFATAIPVTPGTTYVISYSASTPAARYYTNGQYTTAVTVGNVTYPAQAGRFASSTSTFPASTTASSGGYWVTPLVASNDTVQPSVLAAPTSPSATLGTTGATVSWTAPSTSSTITGYNVIVTDTTAVTTTVVSTGSTATSFSPTGLTPGDVYTFQVQAVSGSTESAYSTATPGTSYATAPAVPSAPSAVAGQKKAAVTWTAPSNSGSAITGYTVTATDSTTAANGGQTCTTTGALSCTISGLTAGDSYTFTVAATNSIGTSAASPASAPVTPYDVPGSPVIVSTVGTSTAGSTITVTWTASAPNGSPITGYTVQSYDSTVGASGGTCTTTTVLSCTITGATNGDHYTVTVIAFDTAVLSASSTSAVFLVAGAPTAPTSPSATAAYKGLTASWVASSSNGSAVTGYTATAVDATSTGRGGQTCTTSGALSCTISGLTAGDSYTFTVVGSNAVGNGPVSGSSNAVTPFDVTSAPTNVSVVPGSGQAVVSWSAPSNFNGATVSSYTVTVTDSTSPSHGGQTCTTTGTTCTVTGLSNGDSYVAAVVATNAAGPSTQTVSALFVPAGVPSAPGSVSAVAGTGSVLVSWSAPNANGSPISSYRATATDLTTSANGGQTCTTTGAVSCTLTGLTVGDSYTVTVQAVNTVGTSAGGVSSSVVPYTTPGAPVAPSAAAGASSATVTWTAPTSTGFTTITGYMVTAADTTTVANGGQTCTTSGALSCTVTGLTVGDVYSFTVVASNQAGVSTVSAVSNTVSPYAVPAAVQGVTVTPGDSSVVVTWSAPASNGGATITAYTVTLTDQTNAANGGQVVTSNPVAPAHTISGLTNGDTYVASVTATNAAGIGPAAASAPFTPAGSPAPPATAPTVSVAGPGAITVTWTASPNANGSPIRGYWAGASEPTGTGNSGACSTTGALTCVISGLTGGDSYTVTVAARNGVDWGPGSPTSIPVTVLDTPTTPAAPVVTLSAPTVAYVTWTAPVARGSSITGYTVTTSSGHTCSTTTAMSCTITGLTPGSGYTFTVVAHSSIGDSAVSAPSNQVTAYATTDPPSNVTAVAGDQQAVVSWAAPGNTHGSPVSGYTVTATDLTTPSNGGQTCTTTGLSCTITGVTNGDSYTVVVTATNSGGTSPASVSGTFLPMGLPTTPTAPVAVAGRDSATVTWNSPAANGSTLSGYTVTATDIDNSLSGWQTCTTTTTVLSCLFTGLEANGHYRFSVVAHANSGDSLPSPASNTVLVYDLPTAPSTVSATSSLRTATITWTPPASTNGSVISGYTVTATDTDNTANGGQSCTTTGALTCQISGLTPLDHYAFAVYAVNAAGGGPTVTSTPVLITAEPTPPVTPAASAGIGSATVTWSAPASNDGSPVTGYTVTAVDTATTSRGGQTCTTPATSCTVTGLTPGDTYVFEVTAANALGTSPASVNSNTVIPAAPGSNNPAGIVAVAGDQSVRVSWAAVASASFTVTGYTVTTVDSTIASRGGQSCTTTTARSCTISGVTNGDFYTVTVVAHTSVGDGSGSSAYFTPSGLPAAPAAPTLLAGFQSVTATWTSPNANGSVITSYVATATDTTTPGNGGQTCSTLGALACTISGLTVGDSYTVSVTAGNSNGSSSASPNSPAVVPFAAPSVPLNVTATPGNGVATVSWDAPATSNGSAISGYTVTVADQTVASNGGQTCTTTGALTCSVSGLTNGELYVASVVATNAGGKSGAAVSSAFVPSGPPLTMNAPTAVVAGTASMTLSWAAADANGTAVTGYTVSFATGGTGVACTTTGTSCTVNGLTPGGVYTFTVSASNADGTSPASPASGNVAVPTPTPSATPTPTPSPTATPTPTPTASPSPTLAPTGTPTPSPSPTPTPTPSASPAVATPTPTPSPTSTPNPCGTVDSGPSTGAAPGQVDASGCGTVQVEGSISIAVDQADQSFTLEDVADSNNVTSPDDGISYTVTTNNTDGYSVGIQSTTPTMVSTTSSDTIPFNDILATGVGWPASELPNNGTSTGGTAPLGTGGLIYSQTSRTKENGDLHRVTFSGHIPFVSTGTYTGTLLFTATAN